MNCPQPQEQALGLGSFRFARRYSENRCFFLFLRVLRCFSSPGFLLMSYGFTHGYLSITLSEFPHSDICGSTDICSLPQLFAACHVLLRLPVPRHPPYALLCLAFSCIRASRASYGSPWLPYMALMYGLSLSKNFSCFSLSWLLG